MGIMTNASLLLALGAMVCWGVGDFLIQRSTRKMGDVETLGWIGIVGTVGLLPFVYREIPLLFSALNFWTLLGLGVLTFVVAIINFEALKRGKLSVVEVILEVELPITIVLGMAFFGERLSTLQWGLVAAIFGGILLIALEPEDFKTGLALESGVFLALIAAIGLGGMDFLTALGAKTVSPLLAIWFPWCIFTVLCAIAIVAERDVGTFLRHAKKFPSLIIWMGLIDTAAWLLFAVAVQNSAVSITIAITEAYPAVAMFLGVWINKERILKHQYAGAVITVLASVALAVLS